jgi:hypothetical protein
MADPAGNNAPTIIQSGHRVRTDIKIIFWKSTISPNGREKIFGANLMNIREKTRAKPSKNNRIA